MSNSRCKKCIAAYKGTDCKRVFFNANCIQNIQFIFFEMLDSLAVSRVLYNSVYVEIAFYIF